jgi:hypothetical protein
VNVVLATPCYGGMIHARTAGAIAASLAILTQRGHRVEWLTIEGESLVPRARNMLVRRMLAGNAERIVMIDGDIAFSPLNLIELLAHDEAVIGAAYPKKDATCALVVEPTPGPEARHGIVEVHRIGTGFLSISRAALEAMVLAHPEAVYTVHGGPEHGMVVSALFDTAIRDGRYLSEDWLFCDRWRAMGGRVWMHAGIRLGHIGTKTYEET